MRIRIRIIKSLVHAVAIASGLILLTAVQAAAQEKIQVTGTIKSQDNGSVLPGANVLEVGTTNGTVADSEGKYSLSVSSNATLVFSFIGYLSEELPVNGQAVIDMVMVPDIATLQEVVVVGYGTVKKSDVTGAVVSLKKDDLTPGALINVEQSIQGRAAGVQVYQKSGEPGSAMSVKIRGVSSISAGNDPLYVIDGMPINNLSPVGAAGVPGVANNPNARNPLNGINPADIESIEILKDASATAIYGSRGANGVVLITTKKGSTDRLKVNYSVQYGVSKPSNSLEVLTGEEYRDVLNSIIDAGGGVASERVTNEVVNADWQNELYQSAMTQSHDLNLSGGKDNTKFYASLGYFQQEGVIKKSGTERYTLRLNLENGITKKYALGIALNTSFINDQYNSVGLGINENGSSLYSAIYYDPTYPLLNDNGDYNRSPFMTTIDHPLALVNGQYANGRSFRTFGSVYGEYFILPTLSAKVRVSGDVNTSRKNTWIDPKTIIGAANGGLAAIHTGTVNYYMGEATLNYNKVFNDNHSINAVAGTTYEHFGSESFQGSGKGYTSSELTYDAIGSGNALLNTIGSGRASSVIVSFLGRANYSFKNRYLLTASFRADGSSRFGSNNTFGYFPSAALAWKMHEEPFLSGAEFIDELKLRVSYGSVGSQAIANYLYLATYSANSSGPVFGGNRATLFAPSRLANPDLQWESSAQADVGVDFSFFEKRISGSVEYYSRKTSDLLLDLPQPLSTGFGFKTVNIGSMRNTGVDLMLSGDIIRTSRFTWSVGGNYSWLKNEVLSLGPLEQIFVGSAGPVVNASIIKPGESLGTFYGYKVIGVWQAEDDFTGYPVSVKPGDLKFEDRDGNKIIDAKDRTILGKSLPDFTYGISSTFKYRNLSLSVFLEGAQGGSILNSVAVDSYFPVSFRRNRLAKPYLNRWTPENPTNEYPSFVNPTSQGQQQVNSRTVEDASYLRLQSAQISYNFNFNKGPFRSIQLFVTGQNLFTITNYTGIDPAVNALGDDVLKIDYSSYPMTRTFLVGANFQL
jgi:TonB-dependent starch-binding outer membrane protein SusC